MPQETSAKKPSLATTHPDLAAQAHGWDPTMVTAGSHQEREWMCEMGHTWFARPDNRTRPNGIGCPIHTGRQALAGYNDLVTIDPELAKQAHGWDPTTVTAMSGKKREWICELGHVWNATVASRSQGRGCPICSGHQVLAGFNDLSTTHIELAKQAHGWDPTTVTAGSHKRLEWECPLGHVWKTWVFSRSRGRGCPGCYAMTFDEITRRPLKFRDQQRKHT